MTSRASALVALVTLASIGLGFLLGGLNGDPAPTTSNGQALAQQLETLAAAQDRTAEALERLERTIGTRLEAVDSDRAPAGVDASPRAPESLDGLIASLDSLRVSIENESRRTQEIMRSSPAFAGESMADVRERRATPDWAVLNDLQARWSLDQEATNRSQHLQTAQDLVATYGKPSTIYRPNGGILFVYRAHAEGEAGPASYFRLQDGMVVEYWLEHEQ